MGKYDFFRIGDWNVRCDQCGRKRKASDCRETWQGLFVCSDTCWEARHPQDFVKGRIDIQRVPISRPDKQTMQTTTTLSSAASMDAKSVVVTSYTGVYAGTGLGITLDNGTVQWVYCTTTPTSTTIAISDRLMDDAASGNTVYIMTGDRFITASTSYTATSL